MKRCPRRLLVILTTIALMLLRCTPTPPPTASPTPPAVTPTVALADIAASYVAAGEFSVAETLYHQARQNDPADPRLALELARLYRLWNRPTDGLAALDEAIRNHAPLEETTALRVELLALQGDWPHLIAEAKAYLAVAPNDAHTLEWLTRAYLQTQQCAVAAETAQRWRDVLPGNLAARVALAALSGDAVSLCEADARFCAATTVQVGTTLVRDENWALAACVLARAAAADDASAEAHAWLGEALAQIGRPEEAQPHFLKATTLAPQSPQLWLLLGLFNLGQHKTAAASEALLKARALDPTNPLIYLSLAEVSAQVGDYGKVDAWIAAALDAAPTDVDVAKAAARFYLERNFIQNEYPMRPIQSALQLAPEDGEALMFLGWFRLMAGDATGARAALDEAVRFAPRLGQAHFLRGMALQATGDMEAAQASFTRAADLGYWP